MRAKSPAVLESDPSSGVERLDRPKNDPARRQLYFTLGTIFNQESGDLFTRVLSGLRDLDVDVVVTVGRAIDPAELGEQPPHVQVERFVALAPLLSRCDLLIASLAFGLPSVLLPMGADQPLNADRCVALGVGEVLDPLNCTAEQLRAAVASVLSNPSYRIAAERIRDEITELPGAEDGARLLERLATEGAPIVRVGEVSE